MSDKLLVSLWGLSINAEGLWAIGAATIIVGMVAAIVFARSTLSKPHSIRGSTKDEIH
ncbi:MULTISPECIES: hypothetical protein [unclassified Bradyrhizobium]|uniref:hypothetical protein n=1 Tax=unclassified Bradyrhizobium TaxID=2631580 RepID=UPI001BAD61EA|nr:MULTISPECIES: hypothetical protein [unclassified Bradyrhizobium]MBR1204473.1 hypothetical protein [Bradyrhizobium sp. AUGA SZCCT0124]MBR1309641.1 hypothetical protein [Bradyrhizobium sp. AUGA SZCCT0051]MBR1339782.1 hypothetical protein [Bradyrhizobium sp. AUGA SZCCT0105]MBR1354389.1 hypothetical protein [Bradyrhizobium sp. AUGA SZCCT0045]